MNKREIAEAGAETAGPYAAAATRSIPVFVLSVLMLATGGCQLFETRESERAPTRSTQSEGGPAEREPVRKSGLSTAIEYLATGRGEAARALIAELAEEAPDSRVLAGLLRQIDEPPETLLPGPYRRIEVGAGESLSLIAARELDDPLMFYALARLNEIDVPEQVPVGSVLRVPRIGGAVSRDHEPSAGIIEPAPEITVAEIESVAEYLARSGQRNQARAMLLAKLREGEGAESTGELLVRLTLEQAAEMRDEGAFAPAVAIIDQAVEVMGASGQRSDLVEARDGIRSEMLRQEALRLRDRGNPVAAYQAAQNAANLESAPTEAILLADELREELVGSLHNEALLAWRDRNIDLAIRNWESLLAAVPDFEPAKVYLERARLLRERLDEP